MDLKKIIEDARSGGMSEDDIEDMIASFSILISKFPERKPIHSHPPKPPYFWQRWTWYEECRMVDEVNFNNHSQWQEACNEILNKKLEVFDGMCASFSMMLTEHSADLGRINTNQRLMAEDLGAIGTQVSLLSSRSNSIPN